LRRKTVNAIIEATWHDNTVADTDEATRVSDDTEVTYDQREGISVSEAIDWASKTECPVTLYIYDEGCGTS
jgi:hypothetical protein